MKTKKILEKVKKDYCQIAEEFDVSREKPWPEFEVFLKMLRKKASNKKNIRLLDAGCGNGRLAHFLKDEPIEYFGIDNNSRLLSIAKKKSPKGCIKSIFCRADIFKLPYTARKFDAICAVAVLHHLPTKTLQSKALKEFSRVLKKNGFAFLTVWNLNQPKYKKYIDVKTRHALIPWGNPAKAQRFYYAFSDRELRALIKKAGFSSIKKIQSKYNLAYFIQ